MKLRLPASTAAAAPAAVATSNASDVRSALDKWASYYGVDAHLAHALAWMESGYNNAMVSNVGAQGVMQILPSTWQYVESVLIGHSVSDHGVDGNLVGVADPGLGALGNYGGPTETIPLLPGSPAIDAGTSTGANVIAALRLAERLPAGATVVTVMCDTGMKYLKSFGALPA